MSDYNPFQVLGLEDNADLAIIKERFRELSKVLHPDKQPAANYDQAKDRFQAIDQAYKMICSQFNNAVYEHYGMDGKHGVQIIIDHPDKFKDLEDEFNSTEVHQRRKVIRRIKSHLQQVKHDLIEKDLYNRTFRKIEIFPEFYGGNELQQKVFLRHDYLGAYQVKNGMMVNIALPEVKKVQQELYFYASHAENLNGITNEVHEYGHKTQCMVNSRQFGLAVIKTQVGLAQQDWHGGLTVSKQLTPNINAELSLKYYHELQSNVSLQWKDKNNENGITVWLGADGSASISSNIQTPLGEIDISADHSSISLEHTRFLHKHKFYSTSITTYAKLQRSRTQEALVMLMRSNFRWNISKMMIIELKGTIGFGRNQFDVVVLRGHSKLSIPIVYENHLIPLKSMLIFSIPLVLPFFWNKKVIKPYWTEDVSKRAKKKKMDLEQQRKSLFQVIDKIQTDEQYQLNFRREIQSHGLIILEAYIGLEKNIDELNFDDPERNRDHWYLIPCRHQLQNMVIDSHLHIPAGGTVQLPGLYLINQHLQYKNPDFLGLFPNTKEQSITHTRANTRLQHGTWTKRSIQAILLVNWVG